MKKCFNSCRTIYLSPKGCDNNSGDDPKCPKRSFDAALKAVQHCRSAEIKMKKGTYKWSKLKIRGPSKLRVSGKLKLIAKKLKVIDVEIGLTKAIINVCYSSRIKIGDIVSLVKDVEGFPGAPVVSIDGKSLTIVFPKGFKAAIFDSGINVLRPASILKLPSKPTEITSCQTLVDWIGVRFEGFLGSEEFEIGSVMKLRSCDWSFSRSVITNFEILLSNSSFLVSSCVLRDVNLFGGPEFDPSGTGSRINFLFSLILDNFEISTVFGSLCFSVCSFTPDSSRSQFISSLLSSLTLAELCDVPNIFLSNCQLFTFNIGLFKSNQLTLWNSNWTHEGFLEIVGADVPVTAVTSQIQLIGAGWLLEGFQTGLLLIGSKLVGIQESEFLNTIVVTSPEGSLIICDCSQICGQIKFDSTLSQIKPSFELRNHSHVSLPEGSVDGFKPEVGLPLLFTNLGPKAYPEPGKFMEDRINQAEGTGVGDLSSFTISKAVPVLALKRPRLSAFGRRVAKKE